MPIKKEKELLNLDNKKILISLSIFLLVISSVCVVLKAINEYKSIEYIGLSEQNTMSFSGKGEVSAIPDIASFTFSVKEEGKDSKDAQNFSAKKINEAISYLKKQGIEEKDIKTSNYNVYPRYEWDTDEGKRSKRILVGYVASQSISVKIRDIKKAGDVLSGLGGIGVNNLSGLSFSVDNKDELKREARKLAIEDAKNKAKELSKDLGVNLLKIVSFNEQNGYRSFYAQEKMMDNEASFASESPEIPVGENKITSNITITYQIQ